MSTPEQLTSQQEQEIIALHEPKYVWGDPKKLIEGDARFSKLPKRDVTKAINAALGNNLAEYSHTIPLTADKIFDTHTQLKAGTFVAAEKPEPLSFTIMSEEEVQQAQAARIAKAAAERPLNKVHTIHSIEAEAREDLQKKFSQKIGNVGGGVNLVLGALSALFALDSFSKMNKTDENGQNHVQWTYVGIAVLNTALAAGFAHSGYKALQAGRSLA